MASKEMTETLGLMMIIVIGLGLTPSVISFTGDAQWPHSATEYHLVTSGATNVTSALAHAARNTSTTYGYFTITIVAGGTNTTSMYGLAEIEVATNITYTVSTKIITFDDGVLFKTSTYNMSITYNYAIDAASYTIIGLVPLFWVIAIIAIAVVAVVLKLKGKL